MGSYSQPISSPKVYTQEAIDKALLEVWEKIAAMEQDKLVQHQTNLLDMVRGIQFEVAEIKKRVNQPTLIEYIKFWKR